METETTSNPWGLEPMLDVSELAAYLGVPVSTVYDWRTRGLGPRAYRFGKHLKFAVSDVRIWIEQQRELDTPEQAVTRRAARTWLSARSATSASSAHPAGGNRPRSLP